MIPTINEGDKIEIIPISPKIEIGDIVVYISHVNGCKLIAHRIISISGVNIVTKGDNNYYADKPINKKDLLAQVTRIIK